MIQKQHLTGLMESVCFVTEEQSLASVRSLSCSRTIPYRETFALIKPQLLIADASHALYDVFVVEREIGLHPKVYEH